MHVRQEVVSLELRHGLDVGHLRLDHHDGSGGATSIHGVDHHEGVCRIEHLLHQVDAPYPRLHDPDGRTEIHLLEPLCDDDSETVVAPKEIADPRYQDLHRSRL